MINLRKPISPILSALLLEEFERDYTESVMRKGGHEPTNPSISTTLDTFYRGLHGNELHLSCMTGAEYACSFILVYLDTLLNPEPFDDDDPSSGSGIQSTALPVSGTRWRRRNERLLFARREICTPSSSRSVTALCKPGKA